MMTPILVDTGLSLRSWVSSHTFNPCPDAMLGLDLATHQLQILLASCGDEIQAQEMH